MPSDKHGGRGRGAIVNWRVKAGRKEVFSAEKKQACEIWMRDNASKYRDLKLVPPNV